MLTRVILAAGVAALAISVPAGAKPDRGQGGQSAQVERGGGGERAQRAQRVERQAAPRVERAQRTQRVERQRVARVERAPRIERQPRAERVQRFAQVERRQERANRTERVQVRSDRQQARVNRVERQQVRVADRQQVRANRAERQQIRANRVDRQQVRIANREQARIDRSDRVQLRNDRAGRIELRNDRNGAIRIAGANQGVGYGVDGCPPGLVSKGCMPPGQAFNANRIVNADVFRASRLASLAFSPQTRILNPVQAVGFVGSPLSTVTNAFPLMALPSSVAYLYPDTDDYYYRYGNGYLYEVDRDTSLIAALLPLLAGGFMPGQYLPTSYMNSYVPNYYGLNSFYPASYSSAYGYGYGYDNLCNRYVNGVIYQVDCVTGLVEDVVPLYAGGYGVGQLLPSSYGYYNVPYQYRSMYYNTPDYNYWYAPGAIYQVDPTTSLISSVAALLTPGFSVGQPLPLGYGMYNVPLSYRSTYYDTPNAWYRYNNGYIYQVDPTTQLVTAIVASILT